MIPWRVYRPQVFTRGSHHCAHSYKGRSLIAMISAEARMGSQELRAGMMFVERTGGHSPSMLHVAIDISGKYDTPWPRTRIHMKASRSAKCAEDRIVVIELREGSGTC